MASSRRPEGAVPHVGRGTLGKKGEPLRSMPFSPRSVRSIWGFGYDSTHYTFKQSLEFQATKHLIFTLLVIIICKISVFLLCVCI